MRRAIIFDGDDTLWRTEWLYDRARRGARAVVESAGLDGSIWEELERKIDVENVKRFGHGLARFPTSCVEAYELLCDTTGRHVELGVSRSIYRNASAVFDSPAPLVNGVSETLGALASQGFRLALLTKGDHELQQRRIAQSGLAHLFDLIEIVDEKTPEVIESVIERLGASAATTMSVGNSIRSDILPSLAAGVQPVWIDAHVWEYEREHDPLPVNHVIEIQNISELLSVVDEKVSQ